MRNARFCQGPKATSGTWQVPSKYLTAALLMKDPASVCSCDARDWWVNDMFPHAGCDLIRLDVVAVRERAVRYVDAPRAISTPHRDDLPAGPQVPGPTVITEVDDATTFAAPGFLAMVAISGNLHLVRRNAT